MYEVFIVGICTYEAIRVHYYFCPIELLVYGIDQIRNHPVFERIFDIKCLLIGNNVGDDTQKPVLKSIMEISCFLRGFCVPANHLCTQLSVC